MSQKHGGALNGANGFSGQCAVANCEIIASESSAQVFIYVQWCERSEAIKHRRRANERCPGNQRVGQTGYPDADRLRLNSKVLLANLFTRAIWEQ